MVHPFAPWHGLNNHRKHQKVHSGIVSGRQGPEQARTLARRQHKKPPGKKIRGFIIAWEIAPNFLCNKK